MQKCLDLIKQFEGFSATAYICPAGKVTIGYGSTYWEDGNPVKMGETISQERATILLQAIVDSFRAKMKAYIKVSINENQFDALTCFAYNVGVANFYSSTLLKLINSNKFSEAADQFDKWVYADKKVLPGLIKRRAAEKALFLSPMIGS